jgi:lysophospholipase L1-like esterase
MQKKDYVNSRLILFCLIVLLQIPVFAATPAVGGNVINDPGSTLRQLMSDLHAAEKKQGHSVVSVLHIGDSHLQAGFITEQVRKRLQKKFGNAGRGLIVPLRMAGTNQPYDYKISSPQRWQGFRCSVFGQDAPFGISGFALRPMPVAYSIHVGVTDEKDCFTRIMVLHSGGMKLDMPDGSVKRTEISPVAYYLNLPEAETETTLTSMPFSSDLSPWLNGFSLENDSSGIRYHTVGVNGATFEHYAKLPLFMQQSKALTPRLIILSLGTNESFGNSFSESTFIQAIDDLVAGLKKENPDAVFLLTTPAEDYKRVKVRKRSYASQPNQQIGSVARAIVRYAKEHGIAWWDLYSITGGKGSSKQWADNEMLGKDKIHFSETGYVLQGNLLADALIKMYNDTK